MGTQEIVYETANDVLYDMGCKLCQVEDVTVEDRDEDEVCILADYVNAFCDKAIEKILNVIATEDLNSEE